MLKTVILESDEGASRESLVRARQHIFSILISPKVVPLQLPLNFDFKDDKAMQIKGSNSPSRLNEIPDVA
ncbi:hypothetical protein BTO00_09425 [Vibrio campbellii]|nr:hypothetical protein BTO00_09425 [Vibrio campbellii]